MKASAGYRWASPAVVTTAMLWGTTGVAAAFIPQQNPVAIGAASIGGGGLLLGLTSWRAVRRVFSAPGAARLILIGAVGLVMYMPLFYVSVAAAGAALGTIVSIGSGPLFAGVLEWLLDGKNVSRRWLVSVMITTAGAGLLLAARTPEGSAPSLGRDHLLQGVGAGLVAGMTYALYAFAIGKLIPSCPSRPGGLAHGAVVAAIQGSASVPMLVLLLVVGEHTFSPSVWPVLLYLAVIPTAVGHRLFAYGLGRLKASTATLYTVLEPVVATVLAVLLLGEGFGPAGWAGFPLVVVGLALVTTSAAVEPSNSRVQIRRGRAKVGR